MLREDCKWKILKIRFEASENVIFPFKYSNRIILVLEFCKIREKTQNSGKLRSWVYDNTMLKT